MGRILDDDLRDEITRVCGVKYHFTHANQLTPQPLERRRHLLRRNELHAILVAAIVDIVGLEHAELEAGKSNGG